jgi:hypothetical protein
VEIAVIAHSTGYWYFRDAVDKAAARNGAWRIVYPEVSYRMAGQLVSITDRRDPAADGGWPNSFLDFTGQ